MGRKIALLLLVIFIVFPFVAGRNLLLGLLVVAGCIYLLFRGHNSQGAASQSVSSVDSSQTLQEIAGQIQVAKNVTQDPGKIAGLDEALAIVERAMGATAAAPAVAATAEQPQAAAVAPLSEAEIAAQKMRQSEQNTNTMLYVASFLLVGAAVLFIGTALDSVSKFVGLLVITLGFYGVGLWLHRSMPKLRPAAVAFVGTGLALVPFVGLAFYNYVMPDGAWTWFMTSLIGLAMFMYAAVVIRNQVLAYLTSAFVFSLTTSTISVMRVPFVWYFAMVILTGAVLAYIAYKKPAWLPSDLHQPFEQNGQIAVPLAIAASLAASDRLTLDDYKIIVGLATVFYLAGSLGFGTRTKRLYWLLGRVGVVALACLWAWGMSEHISDVAAALVTTGLLAYLYSRRYMQDPYERGWITYSQAAMAVAAVLWIPEWPSVAFGLIILGGVSLVQLLEFRREAYGLGFIVMTTLLPGLLIYNVWQLASPHQALALIMIVIATVGLSVRTVIGRYDNAHPDVAKTIYVIGVVEAILTAFAVGTADWIATITMIVAAIVFVTSFVEKEPWLLVPANLFFVIALWYSLDYFGVSTVWRGLLTGWIAAGVWYGLRWYYDTSDTKRRDVMLVSTLAILIIAGFISAYNDTTVVAACLTGCAAAALLVYEGRLSHQPTYRDLAVFVGTLSLQRLVAHSYPEASIVFYTHWWAASLALTAWLRLQTGERNDAKIRGILALGMLSIPTGLAAIGDPATYQLLFLMEHIALLIGGFMTNKKLVVRWATVGIALAMIWMLQGYTYVLLALAAFALIGLAIWRLTRTNHPHEDNTDS